MLWVFFVIAVPLAGLGVLLVLGKGGGLIAGYNTLPAYERARYDEKALCRCVGLGLFALAAAALLFGCGLSFALPALMWAGGVLFFGTIAFLLLYLNTGDRFKK